MNGIILIFLSGLSIGILGSFHCIGMCGPLALALPIDELTTVKKTVSILLYNFGRALTYASMGLILGLLGSGFSVFAFQQWLSISAGVLILALVLTSKFGNPNIHLLARFTHKVKMKLGAYLKSEKSTLSYLSIGVVNGFLPCGLVYIAIAASIAAGSVLKSSLLMFAFGLGTLPVMALTMAFGKFISFNLRNSLNKITPYLIMFLGMLLIIRGLNLGIPYISPIHEQGHVSCCEGK